MDREHAMGLAVALVGVQIEDLRRRRDGQAQDVVGGAGRLAADVEVVVPVAAAGVRLGLHDAAHANGHVVGGAGAAPERQHPVEEQAGGRAVRAEGPPGAQVRRLRVRDRGARGLEALLVELRGRVHAARAARRRRRAKRCQPGVPVSTTSSTWLRGRAASGRRRCRRRTDAGPAARGRAWPSTGHFPRRTGP